ncbi:MAG: hypothetical protein AB1714_02960 [Acidobacteriota bacterium]
MRIWALVCIFVVWISSILSAEPYIAVREGFKCSSCHENVTGGGKRTQMGATYGAEALPWKHIDLEARKIPAYRSWFDQLVSIGGDFRFLNESTFQEGATANTFQTDKANLYLRVNLIPSHLSLHVDESLAPGGAQSREIFALVQLPMQGWVKAGKFIQPYGIRLEDDSAFIREVTGFNFNNPDLGVEVGVEPGNWSIALAATNGTAGSLDNNAAKQLVGTLAYVRDDIRAGASGSYNSGRLGDKHSTGLWGGFRLGPAAFLGEADLVREHPDDDASHDRLVTHAEVDFLVHEGWNVKVAYEYYDPDLDVAENQRDRVVIGVEPFLTPFVQLAVFYTFNQSIPQNKPQNADELVFRLHLYF